jgi:HPt (histidine-containing phosphotransfer) domain-containing protein
VPLPATPGDQALGALPPFDLDAALDRLEGNTDLVRRIINTFAVTYADGAATLADLAADGEWIELERFVHSLKSAAGTLGDRSLALTADRLERTCRAGRIARIGPLATRLTQQLTRAAAAAQEFSARESAELPVPSSGGDGTVSDAIVDELDDYLNRRSMKARKIFPAFEQAVRRPATDTHVDAMVAALDRLDFNRAQQLMREIVSTLKVEASI